MKFKILSESNDNDIQKNNTILNFIKVNSIKTINILKEKIKKLLSNKWISRSIIISLCIILIIYFYYKMNGNIFSTNFIKDKIKNIKEIFSTKKPIAPISKKEHDEIDYGFIIELGNLKDKSYNEEETQKFFERLNNLNLATRKYIYNKSYLYAKGFSLFNYSHDLNMIYITDKDESLKPVMSKFWFNFANSKTELDYDYLLVCKLFPRSYIEAHKKECEFLPSFMKENLEEVIDPLKVEINNLSKDQQFIEFIKNNGFENIIKEFIN